MIIDWTYGDKAQLQGYFNVGYFSTASTIGVPIVLASGLVSVALTLKKPGVAFTLKKPSVGMTLKKPGVAFTIKD